MVKTKKKKMLKIMTNFRQFMFKSKTNYFLSYSYNPKRHHSEQSKKAHCQKGGEEEDVEIISYVIYIFSKSHQENYL